MDFILKKFCSRALRLRWPNRSALPLPPSQNYYQNGKHIVGKKARVMLVKMASKSLVYWQGFVPGIVGSVGYAYGVAVRAISMRQCVRQCGQCGHSLRG